MLAEDERRGDVIPFCDKVPSVREEMIQAICCVERGTRVGLWMGCLPGVHHSCGIWMLWWRCTSSHIPLPILTSSFLCLYVPGYHPLSHCFHLHS